MKNLLTFVRVNPFWSGAGVVFIVIIIVLVVAIRGGEAPYEFIVAERGNLVQAVSVTGRVLPAQSVDLAFEISGRVAWVAAHVGDTVGIGQALAGLNKNTTEALLAQSEAKLKAERAKLSELKKGTRPEEIDVQRARVNQARASLTEAKRNAVNTIRGSYTKAEDAVRNKTDQLFTNPRGENPELIFTVPDQSLERNIESRRVSAESLLISWDASLSTLSLEDDLVASAADGLSRLNTLKAYLADLSLAVNALDASIAFPQATVDAYRADVSAARTNVEAALSDLLSANEKLKDKEAALSLAEEELTLKEAGVTPEELLTAEARVEEAEANVDQYRAELEKRIIRSPIFGVVTEQNREVGEIVGSNAPVISLISHSDFEITANIPEADIAKLSVGDVADITLDAYGDSVVFTARVTSINPAETIVEGVSTYKATLQFEERDDRIRSGMTANIDIVTEQRENVFAVPQRAVITDESGKKTVRVLDGNAIRFQEVKTGIRGSFGDIEITEGLKEGDRVVTFVPEE